MNAISRKKSVRSIIVFVGLVSVLAWLGPVLGGDPTSPGLGFLLWGIAPVTSALVVRYALRDSVDMGWRLRWRGNVRYYALSILAYPVTIGGVVAVGVLLGATRLSGLSASEFLRAAPTLALTYLLFAVFEEVGWRGYLAPRVYELNAGLAGHALVALIWASWHLPYVRQLWSHTSEGLATLLPRFLLGTFAFAVVYGEIRIRTGAVWPAVLMHWLGNTFANTLLTGSGEEPFVTFVPGREWVASFGVEGVWMIAIFGFLGALLYLGRRRGSHGEGENADAREPALASEGDTP